jgi:hypothetical protein
MKMFLLTHGEGDEDMMMKSKVLVLKVEIMHKTWGRKLNI